MLILEGPACTPLGPSSFQMRTLGTQGPSDLRVPGQSLAWGPGTCQLGPVCRHGHSRELCSDGDVPRCRVGLNSLRTAFQSRAGPRPSGAFACGLTGLCASCSGPCARSRGAFCAAGRMVWVTRLCESRWSALTVSSGCFSSCSVVHCLRTFAWSHRSSCVRVVPFRLFD